MSRRYKRTYSGAPVQERAHGREVQIGQIIYDGEGATVGTARSNLSPEGVNGVIVLSRAGGSGTTYINHDQIGVQYFTRKMLDTRGVHRVPGEFAEVRPYRRPALALKGARIFYRATNVPAGVVNYQHTAPWVWMQGMTAAVDLSGMMYATGKRQHS